MELHFGFGSVFLDFKQIQPDYWRGRGIPTTFDNKSFEVADTTVNIPFFGMLAPTCYFHTFANVLGKIPGKRLSQPLGQSKAFSRLFAKGMSAFFKMCKILFFLLEYFVVNFHIIMFCGITGTT